MGTTRNFLERMLRYIRTAGGSKAFNFNRII